MRRLTTWLAVASLAGLVIVAYANSLGAALTLDSRLIIGLDPRIQAWSAENLRSIWTESYWGPFARSDLYRPVSTLSYLANYALLGNEARVLGYHMVNTLVHGVNVGLAFVVLRQLGAQRFVGWLAAAIFAVHPVNVEAVTNIVGRADLLATFAVLASGACYIRAAAMSGRPKVGWLSLAGVVATLGAFAKENAVMAIGFALLYDVFWRWPTIRAPHLAARIRSAAWEFGLKGWVAFIPAIVLLWFVRHRLDVALTPAGYSFVDNPILYAGTLQGVLTAIGVIGRYLALWLLPVGLSCDYSYNAIPLHGEGYLWWHDLIPWLSLMAIGGLFWLMLRWRESHRLVAWGLAFFAVMLLPVSNLLLRIGSIMGERFLYLPSLGLCAAVAVALDAVCRRSWRDGLPPRRRILAFVLPALVIGALAARTVARNADWRDDFSLWKSAVAAAPNSFKTHLGLAGARWENEKDEAALDAAIASAETAQRILDRVPLPIERRTQAVSGQLGMFYRLKGEVLRARNAAPEARMFFERAIQQLEFAREIARRENELLRQRIVARNGIPAGVADSGNAKLYLELAICHQQLSHWPELAVVAREAQRHAPSHPGGYAFEAAAEANSGREDAAARHFLAALVLNPNDAELRANLTRCYERLRIRPPLAPTQSLVTIDTTDPRVRQHLNEAFALIVRNHEAAGRPREAAGLRELAIDDFKVPRAMVAAKPDSR